MICGVKPAKPKPAKTKPAKTKPPKATPAPKKIAKQPAPRKPAGKPTAPKMHGPRADFGAPIDAFFAKQGPTTRPILEALRKLVEETVPAAQSSLKWGMPFYTLGGTMMCALGGHKSHVNLILAGPPGTYVDPDGLLEGTGKTGKHLKLTSVDQIPRATVKKWLHTAAAVAQQ